MIVLSGIDRRNGLVIEYMIDELFHGDEAKAFVARMLCKGPTLTPERIEKVMEASKERFPKRYEVSRRTSLAPFVLGIKREIESFLADPDNVRRMSEDVGLPQDAAADESARVAGAVRRMYANG